MQWMELKIMYTLIRSSPNHSPHQTEQRVVDSSERKHGGREVQYKVKNSRYPYPYPYADWSMIFNRTKT